MTADVDPAHRYSLTAPCRHCPFRLDIEPYLRAERAREIAAALRGGAEFPCHATTVTVVDDEGDEHRTEGPRSRFCAGALAVMENEDQPNQMARIAERFGWYDPAKIAAVRPLVHPSLSAWVNAHTGGPPTAIADDGTVVDFEHCGVVDDDCEDPAGYGGYGGAVENDDDPTCNPLTDECAGCARPVCVACRSQQWGEMGDQFCASCWISNEEDHG